MTGDLTCWAPVRDSVTDRLRRCGLPADDVEHHDDTWGGHGFKPKSAAAPVASTHQSRSAGNE